MKKSIRGTRTEKNLLKSFIGESQAKMRYTYFASQAKEEGFEQISAIFTEISDNEKEHAKRFFGFLEGGSCDISGTFAVGIISSTINNLKFSVSGENEEYLKLYPEAAKIADDDGFPAIAECYRKISIAEKYHETIYLKFINNIENNRIFEKDVVVKWKCRNCGYVYESKEALKKCSACLYPMSYMEELI
ncbi:MAG: rubrerythrin family protein [Endomicrobium sp.]|jgi:rubrerythrin|nr:rubrerythrin family protein [Endomicrobium sp.]